MPYCDRAFSLGGIGVPRARSFELPGDYEQYAPDRPADVQHIKLEIALDFEQETISGVAYTTFKTLYEELRTVPFDAFELAVERVWLADGGSDKNALRYDVTGSQIIVTLDRAYHYGEQFTVAIAYHARPRTGLHFIKPGPEDPTRPVQDWTFGQPRYHSHWFPCHDAPNDRATTEIIVMVPARFLTVSNGNLLGITEQGTGESATKTYHWRHDVPHAAYLVSLVVADFAVIEDSYKGKPVNYYVRKDRAEDARYLMGKTPEMMRFFSEFTGVEYPYDKYAQTVVELYTGAMEHTTCTTHSFSLLLDQRAALDVDYVPVVAHELAHQWFGDLLTCRDWSHGWLNEGFATYFEHLWIEHDEGSDVFKQAMLDLKQEYLGEDRRYRRPVVYNVYHDEGAELFDGHLYNKGAWVLHMLRHQLGEAAFRRSIKAYIDRYREQEVITANLERTIEEVSGRSMARFFQQWIYSGGYPAFNVSYAWDDERKMAKVRIKQEQQVNELTPCFVTPVDLAFTLPLADEGGQEEANPETRTVSLQVMVGEDGQVEQSFYLPLEREPLMVRFDPNGWLLKTLKFERPFKMLRYQLLHDPDVLGRIEAAEALGDQTDIESLGALTIALHHDSFWGVRAAAASALGTHGTEQAHGILVRALESLTDDHYSRVRVAIASALGKFQAPQQASLSQRSAEALYTLLERGDVSYRVESVAAESLGRTRAEGGVAFLTTLVERPSWMYFVHRGIFTGLGASGDDRAIEVMTSYLTNPANYVTLRAAAAMGLREAGRNYYLYSEEARQRAVTALCNAVAHDSWGRVRALSAVALEGFGEQRAIEALEEAAERELESFERRTMRVTIQRLRDRGRDDQQLKALRRDVDGMREENRKLRDQLSALEARVQQR